MKLLWCLYFLSFPFLCLGQDLKIESIEIAGYNKTKKKFLEDFIRSNPGDIYDSTRFSEDIIQLIRLPSVAHAMMAVDSLDENQVNISIQIEENKTIIPSLNIWTQDDQVVFQTGVYDFNAFGRNATIGGFYQYNGKHAYGVTYSNPFLFSNKAGLALNFQSWTSDEPLYFDQGAAIFEYNNNSVELLGLYRFNFHHTMELGANVFRENYTYLNEGVSVPEGLQQLSLNKLLFKIRHTYIDVIQFYFYKDGFENDFFGQSVINEGETDDPFMIFWNDLKYYKRISLKGNWATRLRIGAASNRDSPFAPFVLDNNVNIRGVGDRIERGTAVVVLNTEYRQTLYESKKYAVQGVGFIDSGAWRTPGGKWNDLVEEENLKLHAGLGFRLIHKRIYSAVLRVDYGYGLLKNDLNGLVVGIGQYF